MKIFDVHLIVCKVGYGNVACARQKHVAHAGSRGVNVSSRTRQKYFRDVGFRVVFVGHGKRRVHRRYEPLALHRGVFNVHVVVCSHKTFFVVFGNAIQRDFHDGVKTYSAAYRRVNVNNGNLRIQSA